MIYSDEQWAELGANLDPELFSDCRQELLEPIVLDAMARLADVVDIPEGEMVPIDMSAFDARGWATLSVAERPVAEVYLARFWADFDPDPRHLRWLDA